MPGSLVATSASGTLVANSWNTVPITATLAPNTSYFFGYNTNGASGSVNNLRYASGGHERVEDRRVRRSAPGRPPSAPSRAQAVTFSIYASLRERHDAPRP